MARAAATVARPASAPARRPARAPVRRTPARRAPTRRPVVVPTGVRLLDGLLHGRAWIALVGVLLVGIVFFNVDLLRVNRQIAHTSERTTTLKRDNSRMRLEVARLSSTDRVQRSAAQRGLTLPEPGQVYFLRARPTTDARRAAQVLGRQDSAASAGAAGADASAPSQQAPSPQQNTAAPQAATPQPIQPTQTQGAAPAQPQAAQPGAAGTSP